MRNKHGDFIWYELLTDDADGAETFYGDIFGWHVVDSGQASMDYRILQATDADDGDIHRVGGMLPLNEAMKAGGVRPTWLGYIGVDDVDASIARLSKAGASIMMPATDLPDVGRLAMLADPQGAPFYVMRGASEATSLAFAFDRPRIGHCAWNELITSAPEAAKQFYGAEFGWEKDGDMDMGPMGRYEFLRHGGLFGALMPKPDAMPAPMWHFYFRVPDIDAAIEKITKLGGELLHGPDEVPGGDFAAKGFDPQGALFAVVGTRP